MSDMSSIDPDEVLARISRDVAGAQERAAAATRARERIDTVRGRARSSRGEVVAVVDPSGLLVDLELSEAATTSTPAALAALIRRTVHDAHLDAAERAVAIADDELGAGSAVSRRLRDELADRTDRTAAEPS